MMRLQVRGISFCSVFLTCQSMVSGTFSKSRACMMQWLATLRISMHRWSWSMMVSWLLHDTIPIMMSWGLTCTHFKFFGGDSYLNIGMNYMKVVEWIFLYPLNQRFTPTCLWVKSNSVSLYSCFVDELLNIGALGCLPEEQPIKITMLLFCVPKPGQPGQWRVIANMQVGGQNETVGMDLVYLPWVTHIFNQMYIGSYTAIVDALKLSVQHTPWWSSLVRSCLSLGSSWSGSVCQWVPVANSPTLGGCYGLAFLGKLWEQKPSLCLEWLWLWTAGGVNLISLDHMTQNWATAWCWCEPMVNQV